MQITQLISSFNAGELSPLLYHRSDLEKYRSGCKTLENMLITPYGGVRRRPGQEYIATAKDGKIRLAKFQYSTSDAYILEWGEEYMRVFKNGAPVMSGMSPYEIETPYQESELFEFQIAQVNNIAYIVHPNHAPRKLSRTADDSWTLALVDFETLPGFPPLLDENADEAWTIDADFDNGAATDPWVTATTYAPGDRVTNGGDDYVCKKTHTSGSTTEPGTGIFWKTYWTLAVAIPEAASVIGQSVDLTSSKALFDSDHVGAFFELAAKRDVDNYEVDLQALTANDGTNSGAIAIQGKWSFNTFGTWKGIFTIERSKDQGSTWEDIRQFESDGDRNVSYEGEEDSRVLLRIRWDEDTAVSGKPRGVLSAVDGFIRGLVKITAVTDSTHADAVTILPIEKTTTQYWSEGAWSDFRGFPRTVTAHEQRIVYGGNAYRTQTLWGSCIDDYENFKRGVEDDDSWAHSLAASEQNAIQWLLSQKQLLIGTTGGEWVLASSKDDLPVTPTNVRARRHSNHGGEFLPASLVNAVTLFVQRGGRKVRELVFSYEQDGYVSADLTMLAEHVTTGGVVQTAFQQQRDAILWCVTGDGELIGMTYERDQNVVGWHRHVTGSTGDGYESVAVMATPGEEDEVWVSVRRTIDETESRYIERFKPDQFREQVEGDLDDLFFVDAGKKTTGVGLTGMTGLSHLEGETVQVMADGEVLTSRIIAGGAFTLSEPSDPDTASVLVAGLQYASLVEPMPLEIGMQNGTSASRQKRIHRVAIAFYQTSGAKIGATLTGDFDILPFRTTETPLGDPPALFSGVIEHQLDARHDFEASFVLKQDSPLPFSVLAVIPKFNINGDQI